MLLNSMTKLNKKLTDTSTEEQVLKAAEKIFLSKGYSAAKTVEIADEAGVNHALLHYYFRTKENLFKRVFMQKIEIFIKSFRAVFFQNLPFFDLVKQLVETQFDFLEKNDKLPYFLIQEIIACDEHRNMFLELFSPTFAGCITQLDTLLKQEIEKGTIRNIRAIDLMLTISSLNVFFFIIRPAGAFFPDEVFEKHIENVLQNRKEVHVEIIFQWMKK